MQGGVGYAYACRVSRGWREASGGVRWEPRPDNVSNSSVGFAA